jgi:hypothetical protein
MQHLNIVSLEPENEHLHRFSARGKTFSKNWESESDPSANRLQVKFTLGPILVASDARRSSNQALGPSKSHIQRLVAPILEALAAIIGKPGARRFE